MAKKTKDPIESAEAAADSPSIHVIHRGYSQFYDVTTGVQFSRILDHQTGMNIAYARIDEADLAEGGCKLDYPVEDYLLSRGFEIVSDEEFAAITTYAPPASEPEATEPTTGDPLTDEAEKSESALSSAPPPPPSSSAS